MESKPYSTTLLIFKSAQKFFDEKQKIYDLKDLTKFINQLSVQIKNASNSADLAQLDQLTKDEIVVLFRPLKQWFKLHEIKFSITVSECSQLTKTFSANQHNLLLCVLMGNYTCQEELALTFWSKLAEVQYDIRLIREFYKKAHKDSYETLNWREILPSPEQATDYLRDSIIKELCPLVFQQTRSAKDLISFLEVLAEYQLNHFIEIDQLLPLLRSDYLIKNAIKTVSNKNLKLAWFEIIFSSLATHVHELEARAELIALEKDSVCENLLLIIVTNLEIRNGSKLSTTEMLLVSYVLSLCFQLQVICLDRIRAAFKLAVTCYDQDLTLSANFLHWIVEERNVR